MFSDKDLSHVRERSVITHEEMRLLIEDYRKMRDLVVWAARLGTIGHSPTCEKFDGGDCPDTQGFTCSHQGFMRSCRKALEIDG